MTNLQEAKLAREAEISYATLAMVTDYDCWREGHDDVTVEQVIAVMHQNSGNAQRVVKAAVRLMPGDLSASPAQTAAKYAIMTDRATIPGETKKKLDVLFGKYLVSERGNALAILVVGSVAFDSLETPSGKRERVLGGAATHFALAASFFTQVRVVGVVGEDFLPAHEAVLTNKKVDTTGIERAPGKSFHWKGEYLRDLNEADTLATDLNVFGDFEPKNPRELS